MPLTLILPALIGYAFAFRVPRKQRVSTKQVGRVPIYGESSGDERFLVYFEPQTADSVLEEFCAGRCIYQGHPDAGGIPFVVMKGESEMVRSVFTHQDVVKSVEHDGEMKDDVVAEDQSAGSTWGLKRVGITDAQGSGKGANIYVLDSGVRVTHQEFQPNRAIPTLDASSLPPKVCSRSDTQCANDGRGHGTHVAGSAGGNSYGVAPKSTIRAINRGYAFTEAYAAIDWVAVNYVKPAVLTMSFGGEGTREGAQLAVDAVVASGVTVTTSAGNNNYDACRKTFAFIPSAIVVASSDSSDARSSFSNFGSCVTIFAPGSKILSASYKGDEESKSMSGTSMATPHVAGGAAVILGINPSLSPDKVKKRLLQTAEVDAITDAKSVNLLLNLRA